MIKDRWRPKAPKPIPRYFDEIELTKLKLAAEKSSLRDRTIFELLLTTGARVSEVHRLNVDDIELENSSVEVLGKGKKIRTVHFSETCTFLLEKYIKDHPNNKDALFLNKDNERLSIEGIRDVICKLGVKAGLNRRVTPHCLRHSMATHLLSKGAELEFIKKELGHSNMNTTRIYARVLPEALRSQYRKCM